MIRRAGLALRQPANKDFRMEQEVESLESYRKFWNSNQCCPIIS